MRAHVKEMEATPFDGCVFHVMASKDGKPAGKFDNECWGKRAFTDAELQPAIDDLKATPFKRFTENFLRFNILPGDVDWFDDFAPILQNARLAARVAKAGGCRGILFDIEQYNFPAFTYPKQRGAKTKTWDDYAHQTRQRGREVMGAFQDGYPGVTIFLTFGYTLPRAIANGDAKKLPEIDYGLLCPFLDGMLDAAGPDVKLVDGTELSYAYQTAAQFAKARQVFTTDVLPFVGNADAYRAHFQLGFGLWLDDDWRKKGWNDAEPAKNYFTPEKFESAARDALHASDRYVWIYTEEPRWWTNAGKPEKLPAVYDAALRHALEAKKTD